MTCPRDQLRTAAHRRRLRAPHRPHRPGRKSGDATSLVSPEEKPRLADIEKLIKFKIEQVTLPGFEPGAPAPREEREHKSSHRHGRDRERRNDSRRDRTTAPVHLPAPAAHLPAADGFDYSKPYEPQSGDAPGRFRRRQETSDTAAPSGAGNRRPARRNRKKVNSGGHRGET
jgi:ATP-dependent RNA helicase RhlE